MATKAYENIIYEKRFPIAYVTLNRPDRMNALSDALQLEVRDALEDAGWEDEQIRVIVLKGAGRCFSAGFDISGAPERNAVEWHEHFFSKKFHTAHWDVFWGNPKPLIAQVHSYCLAGGLATASFCDLCICSEDALFGYPYIRVGAPYIGAIWPWIFGIRKTRELLYTGNLIDASEALRLGLVNKVVPRNKLEEEVDKLAKTISKVPAINVKYCKQLINKAYEEMGIRHTMEHSDDLEAICYASTESIPERKEFQRIIKEKGLKAALHWNNARFAEEDAWFKERKPR
jgi:enoyl-CoA hydratase/carnithine racemase